MMMEWQPQISCQFLVKLSTSENQAKSSSLLHNYNCFEIHFNPSSLSVYHTCSSSSTRTPSTTSCTWYPHLLQNTRTHSLQGQALLSQRLRMAWYEAACGGVNSKQTVLSRENPRLCFHCSPAKAMALEGTPLHTFQRGGSARVFPRRPFAESAYASRADARQCPARGVRTSGVGAAVRGSGLRGGVGFDWRRRGAMGLEKDGGSAAVAEERIGSAEVGEAKELAAELCKHFYNQGWVSGTGGSITLKVLEPEMDVQERLIVMAPSGVQKERMLPEDMYVMSSDGTVLSAPSAKKPPHKPPKCSECCPLFLKAYQMRNAGAVIHSHGLESCLATMINPTAKEFRITHMEMIKGIAGHGYYDELVVPIIENSAREYELTDALAAAMEAYPKATAVLVRNHGIYIWGESWISAKTQAECYHYLFDAALKLHQLGLDPADPKHGPLTRTQVFPHASASKGATSKNVFVLDIEGTTTPISFVTEVLFPYAKENVGGFLRSTYNSTETLNDIRLLRDQVHEDLRNQVPGATEIPAECAGIDAVITALEKNVQAMIKADRKVTALKELQGHIWRVGYENGELKGVVFDDVPEALAEWHARGIKTYIYSSGSREAQKLIFGNTNFGDLRLYLSGFFDTTIGNKREPKSYKEIYLTVGVDHPNCITFATDVLAEAVAAKEAGLQAVLLLRPGNAPLPSDHGFRTVKSLLEL